MGIAGDTSSDSEAEDSTWRSIVGSGSGDGEGEAGDRFKIG